ncbi:translation initiation factor IF-6 [Vulcanisaeta distributa]|uniref:Translation initiation factor 6 n=1 Tax=Vulcanisaeta distributa (strain DSM 14429 / JCM 11212 / NBRC 100878 / IC-017) TaxID=572478 RepID=E1QRD5_VULDI|nr:translation initiation factor IF-6 [Vulcanisaeta distributa]ADN50632.1 translation initiation factor eIF-6 [Vulcanisaeta distributa DSM 14429]
MSRRRFEVAPLSIYGTSTIGVYIFTNNTLTIVPMDVPDKVVNSIRDTLGTSVLKASLAKSPLIGIFMVGNDNGVLVPSIVTEDEVNELKKNGLNVSIIRTRYTAIANLILTNNRKTIVSPIIEKEYVGLIRDTLGTEVIVDEVCGTYLVGSIAVANDKGVLLSPEAKDEDVRKVKDYFGLTVNVGTVNRGRSFLRGGLVVNNNGGLVGSDTTGFEIVRIMQVFGGV